MNFEFIKKIKFRYDEEKDDVEYIVTPKAYSDIIFSFTEVDVLEGGGFTANVKILRSQIENSARGNQLNIVLTDEYVYDKLKESDPIRNICNLCMEELIIYLVDFHVN